MRSIFMCYNHHMIQNDPEDNIFPEDKLFYGSTDPLMREMEERRHPDTGKRISIVQGRVGDVISQAAVKEAASGIPRGETENLPPPSAEKLSKN